MSESSMIDDLVQTYRVLNTQIRQLDENTLSTTGTRDVIRRLRDDELKFSQALKERVSGVPMPEIFADDALPSLGTETAEDSTATLIAQFGTARESTLAMLRSVAESEWVEGSPGERTIRDRVSELIESDRRQLDRILSVTNRGTPR